MSDAFWKFLQIIVWVVIIVSIYYTNIIKSGEDMAKISERVAVIDSRSLETERKTNNELLGYQELLKGVGLQLGEMNERLSRMEGRMDMRRGKT